jgi:hypothetical protein
LFVLLISVLCVLAADAGYGATETEFSTFWKTFKSAVAGGDKATVAAMTKFPMSMYGSAIKNRAEFLRRYNEIFKGEANAVACFAAAKPHTIGFGKWMPVKLFTGADEAKGMDLRIRTLNVDGHLREFTTGEPHERFEGLTHRAGPSGAPILDGVLAYVDCSVDAEITAGTHTIFIGKVLEAGDRPGAPLGYYDRAFRDFQLG